MSGNGGRAFNHQGAVLGGASAAGHVATITALLTSPALRVGERPFLLGPCDDGAVTSPNCQAYY